MRYKIGCGIVPPNDRPELVNPRNKHHHTLLEVYIQKKVQCFSQRTGPLYKTNLTNRHKNLLLSDAKVVI